MKSRGNRSPCVQVRKRLRRDGGWVLIQAFATIFVMLVIASMAVDIGLYYTAKVEIVRAADAAALAAAATLSEGQAVEVAQAQAVLFAQQNPICGQDIQASAVTFTAGTWQNNAFVADATPYTAVQVKLRRSKSCNNPVSLFFGRIIGIASVDIAATSTVRLRPPAPNFNLVGIDDASFASIGVLAQIKGRFVGNGDVSVGRPLGLLVSVQGDARSYGGQVKKGALAAISGSQSPLSDPLVYPSVELPLTNDNDRVAMYLDSQGDFTAVAIASIPAGVYVVRDLNFLAGVSINLQGPVTFYVQRNFNLAVGVNLLGSTSFSAENFKVRVLPGGYVFFLATILAPLNMDLYAPDSDILVAVGLNAYKGRLIGKTLRIGLPLPGVISEDQSLGDPLEGLPRASIVK